MEGEQEKISEKKNNSISLLGLKNQMIIFNLNSVLMEVEVMILKLRKEEVVIMLMRLKKAQSLVNPRLDTQFISKAEFHWNKYNNEENQYNHFLKMS